MLKDFPGNVRIGVDIRCGTVFTVFVTTTCTKCQGTGRGPWKADGGRCWKCDGTGDSTPVRHEVTDEDRVYQARIAEGLAGAVARRRARRMAS